MISNPKEYYNTLKDEILNSNISNINNILVELFKIINNPNLNAKQLKSIIELDQFLTLRILRIANSPYYGSVSKINSIQQAIVWIGFDAIIHIALISKVIDFFDESFDTNTNFSMKNLWTSSIISALIGKAIYRREFCESGNFIYTAALFHNIGLLFLAKLRKEDLKNILTLMETEKKDLYHSEYSYYGFDHAKLAADILDCWGLPKKLSQTIKYHHNPVLAPKELRKEASCLFIIDQFIEKNSYGFSDIFTFCEYKTQAILNSLNLNETMLLSVFNYINEETIRLKQMGWV